MVCVVDSITLESLEEVLRGSSVWDDFSPAFLYMSNLNKISVFLEYSCVITYNNAPTCVGITEIRLIGLHYWMLGRTYIGANYVRSPKSTGSFGVDIAEVPDIHIEYIKNYLNEHLERVHNFHLDSKSPQKTPAFIECLVKEAIKTVCRKGHENKIIWKPCNGFAITGGPFEIDARESSWLLMRAVISDILGEEKAHRVVVTYYLRLIEDNLNLSTSSNHEIKELFQEAVDIITDQLVIRFGCNVDEYLESIQRIRIKMGASINNQSKVTEKLITYDRFDIDWPMKSSPQIHVHPLYPMIPDVDLDRWNRGLKAIGLVDRKPVINMDNPHVFREVLSWCIEQSSSGRDALISSVIEDIFIRASKDLNVSFVWAPRLFLEEIQAIVKLKDLYLLIMKRKGMELESVCLSNRVLVEWICCCLVHRQCVLTYPHIKHYRLPIDHTFLSVLCVDTKERQQAVLTVCAYIHKYSGDDHKKYLFHPSHPNDTFDFAKQHFSCCSEMQRRFALEEVELEQRKDAYWAAVLRKQEVLKRLRRELGQLEKDLVVAEKVTKERKVERILWKKKIDAEITDCPAKRSLSASTDSKEEILETILIAMDNLYDAAVKRRDSFSAGITNFKAKINETLQTPQFMVNPLPEDKEEWKVIIFFQEMPMVLNILSNCLVSCYSALTEPNITEPNITEPVVFTLSHAEKQEYESLTRPMTRPAVTWAEHHNKHSSSRKTFNKGFLHYPMSYEIPAEYGKKSVDEITDRSECSSIWFPGPVSSVMHSSLRNLFQIPFKLITTFFAEYSENFQFILNYPAVEMECNDKGNIVHIDLADIPDGFTLPNFIYFSSIRSVPTMQIRKLVHCLRGNSLPWSNKLVRDVVAMVLYQMGEVEDSKAKWMADGRDNGLWDELTTSLLDRVNDLRQTPSDCTQIPTLSLLARFLASHTGDLSITRALSVIAEDCARLAHQEFEGAVVREGAVATVNQEFLLSVKAKEALMLGFAILCQADALFKEDVADLLKWIVQFSNILSVLRVSERTLVVVKESVEVVMSRKIQMIDSLIDDRLLTDAFKEVAYVSECSLHWTRVANSYCYWSFSRTDPASTITLHYMINCLTGLVLVNG